jgi:nucleotide-binding universal stress UspA family protein
VYPSSIPITEILYATDFSEPSRRALACARQIARRRGALLRALHVVDLMGHIGSTHSSFNAAIEGARRSMRIMRRELRLAGIREDSTIIPAGSISLAIRDAAVRYHSTLLVMGLHGEPSVSVPTFGGNLRRLFRSTPCPILTVGMRGPGNREPTFERVLYVTDMSADSVTAAQQAWPLDATCTPMAHFAVLPPDGAPESNPTFDVPPGLAPLRLVADQQAAVLIVAKASEDCADLIVVGLRGNGYLDTLASGAVIRAILSKATCPVLVARAAGEPLAPLRERFAAARNRKPAAS